MNTQVYVRGGSPTTQAALVSSKGAFTDALVEQFFNEAKTSGRVLSLPLGWPSFQQEGPER